MKTKKDYDYRYARPTKYGHGFSVIEVSTYPESSVLAGQDKITFIDGFDTLEECWEAYPDSKDMFHNKLTEPTNTYDHLGG